MLPPIWMRVIFLGIWFSSIQGLSSPTYPAIAMVCGKVTQHVDVRSGEWISDPSRTKDCMTDPSEILRYCREVYPKLNVTNVVKQSKAMKIQPWCSIGHTGSTCKGRSHTVSPIRCVVGAFHVPSFVVATGCTIDSLHEGSLCKGHSYWKAKASEKCQKLVNDDQACYVATQSSGLIADGRERSDLTLSQLELNWIELKGMSINDEYSPMSPCEHATKWHGIEFVCCEKTKKNPEKDTKKRIPSNLDPVCLQPKKIGMCRAALDAWYFDRYLMRCGHFTYGGCGGNDNRFKSLSDCKERCKVTPRPIDELLNIPPKDVLLGVGPVLLDNPDHEVTTLASSEIQSQESDTSYLDSAMDPEREHEMYMKSRMQQLDDHQHKVAQATRQWDDAKTSLLQSGGSQNKLAQLDEDFHKTVTALTNEHKQKQGQLLDAHLARVDAHVVESRQAAFQSFKDALNVANPDPARVFRAFKRYIKSEHKDQMHTAQHFSLALEGGSAVSIQTLLQDRLGAIQARVSNAMKLARMNPDVESDTLDEMNELAQRKVPIVSLTLTNRGVTTEPVRIDNGGLPAENTEHREEVSLDEIDEEEADIYDHDETYVSSDNPKPLKPIFFPDGDFDDFSIDDTMKEFNENLDVVPAHVYDVGTAGETSYSEGKWMRWLIGFGGGLGVVLLLVAVAKFWQIRHVRRQHFTKLEVDDHLTAEERQLLQMQQNGYENPTYKFFEKQQVA